MLIQTTHGEIDDSRLRRVDGALDNDHECTTWIEYYLGDELVHRSVHVTIKEWPAGLEVIADHLG